jgi:tight adherence protein C
MVVSVEAGLGLNAAMMKVSTELKRCSQAIATEFELANLEIRWAAIVTKHCAISRANRCRRSSQSRRDADSDRQVWYFDRKGLRVFSDSLRTKRRQRAEQEAQKAAVKLLFPLACFLFPTLFIAILGPLP